MVTIVDILRFMEFKVIETLNKLNSILNEITLKKGIEITSKHMLRFRIDMGKTTLITKIDSIKEAYLSNQDLLSILLYPEKMNIKKGNKKIREILNIVKEIHEEKRNVIGRIDKLLYTQLYTNIKQLFTLSPQIHYDIFYEYFGKEKAESRRIKIEHTKTTTEDRVFIGLGDTLHTTITITNSLVSFMYFEREPIIWFEYDIKTHKYVVKENKLNVNINELIDMILNGFSIKYKSKVYEFIYSELENVIKTLRDIIKCVIVSSGFIKRIMEEAEKFQDLITGLL